MAWPDTGKQLNKRTLRQINETNINILFSAWGLLLAKKSIQASSKLSNDNVTISRKRQETETVPIEQVTRQAAWHPNRKGATPDPRPQLPACPWVATAFFTCLS